MSLVSRLLGGKPVNSGPDFAHQEQMFIGLGAWELGYKLPGNLSNFFGFAQKRRQSPPPRSVQYAAPEQLYKQVFWREESFLDAGIWDYLDAKRRELATLNLSLVVVRTALPHTDLQQIAEHIRACYEVYLNGPEGVNTEMRKSLPDHSDAELASLLVQAPATIAPIELQQTWLHWRIFGESQSRDSLFYIKPLDDRHWVMARFRYSMTGVEGHKLRDKIEQDIQRICSGFSLQKN